MALCVGRWPLPRRDSSAIRSTAPARASGGSSPAPRPRAKSATGTGAWEAAIVNTLSPGDTVLMRKKPTGTLVLDDLNPGKHLYLLSTGTGLAPFMSVIQDPETYERFEKVILVHGVRYVNEVAYKEFITEHLPRNEFFGDALKNKLIYYPTVTREPFENQGRLTDLMRSGKLFADIGLPPINPQDDRAMICGSPSMLDETSEVLDSFGLKISARMREPGDYLIERAFVEK